MHSARRFSPQLGLTTPPHPSIAASPPAPRRAPSPRLPPASRRAPSPSPCSHRPPPPPSPACLAALHHRAPFPSSRSHRRRRCLPPASPSSLLITELPTHPLVSERVSRKLRRQGICGPPPSSPYRSPRAPTSPPERVSSSLDVSSPPAAGRTPWRSCASSPPDPPPSPTPSRALHRRIPRPPPHTPSPGPHRRNKDG